MDNTAAGTADGLSWTNAWDIGEFDFWAENNAAIGDTVWVMGGLSYAGSSDIDTAKDGSSSVAPIFVIGVASGTSNEPPIVSDYADTTGRPTFAMAQFNYTVDNTWTHRNMQFTISDALGFNFGLGNVISNCRFHNFSGTANRNAITITNGPGTLIIDTEIRSNLGDCIDSAGSDSHRIHYVYCHDSNKGFGVSTSSRTTITDSIFDNIATTAIDIESSAEFANTIINNTIYDVATGVDIAAATGSVIYNNIFDNCSTVAVIEGITTSGNLYDHNNYSNNTADTTNVSKGPNATAVDPQFTNAAEEDFSIGTNLQALGYPGVYPGGTTESFVDIGAVQREEAGGAAATTSYGFSN